MADHTPRNVAIVVFDGVEILDFSGPYEVLNAAQSEDGRLFSVTTLAAESRPITCSGGLQIIPGATTDNHPALDIVLVPGGDTRGARQDGRLTEWLRSQAETAELITSVCTGAFLLGDAALLAGKRATTHWGAINRLREAFPDTDVVSDERVVDTGQVVTAAGVSAGIDMALYLVERLHGREVAEGTARYMEYDWRAPALSTG